MLDRLSIYENGLLYAQDTGPDGNTIYRVLAPVSVMEQILYQLHSIQIQITIDNTQLDVYMYTSLHVIKVNANYI